MRANVKLEKQYTHFVAHQQIRCFEMTLNGRPGRTAGRGLTIRPVRVTLQLTIPDACVKS